MAHDRAGYRNHCGECRHFELDERSAALLREVYGEHMPDVYRCEKQGIRVGRFDSPQNPISAAAGCIHYEKANGIDNEPNPKEN